MLWNVEEVFFLKVFSAKNMHVYVFSCGPNCQGEPAVKLRCSAVLADAIILKFHIDEILPRIHHQATQYQGIRETQDYTCGDVSKFGNPPNGLEMVDFNRKPMGF